MTLRSTTLVLAGALAVLAVACGSDPGPAAPSATAASVTTAATPAPSPSATPTPVPSPSPSPCTTGLCEPPVTSVLPPARLSIRVFSVVDDRGKLVPVFDEKGPFPVGYRLTIDATAKDEEDAPTNGTSNVNYSYSDTSLVKITGNHEFQTKLTILYPGTMTVWAELDGITSNVLELTFVR